MSLFFPDDDDDDAAPAPCQPFPFPLFSFLFFSSCSFLLRSFSSCAPPSRVRLPLCCVCAPRFLFFLPVPRRRGAIPGLVGGTKEKRHIRTKGNPGMILFFFCHKTVHKKRDANVISKKKRLSETECGVSFCAGDFKKNSGLDKREKRKTRKKRIIRIIFRKRVVCNFVLSPR